MVVAPSTCRSQSIQKVVFSEHFSKSACDCGKARLEVKMPKASQQDITFGPLLDVQASFFVAGEMDSAPRQK